MCRAPTTPATIPKRTLVQLYAACIIELAVVAFLAFYEPPKEFNKCATAFFALGTTTIDLVLLAFIRCATYIVIAHRTPPSSESADLWSERLSHVSLVQLTYGIAKGVSRALGARLDCHSSTEIFDACCAAFAIFGQIGPMFLERRLRTKAKRTDLTEPLLGEDSDEPPRKTTSTIKAIAAIARPDAHLFWLAMVFAVLAALATSAVSLWTGDALDALIAHGDGAKPRGVPSNTPASNAASHDALARVASASRRLAVARAAASQPAPPGVNGCCVEAPRTKSAGAPGRRRSARRTVSRHPTISDASEPRAIATSPVSNRVVSTSPASPPHAASPATRGESGGSVGATAVLRGHLLEHSEAQECRSVYSMPCWFEL